MKKVLLFILNEDGISSVEYIIAGTLIVVFLVAGFALLGTRVDNRLLFLRNSLSME